MTLPRGSAFIGLSWLLVAFPALALSWDLPAGRFERQAAPGELKQVQMQAGKGLRLVFASGDKHALAVVDTRYRMTAQKFSDYHVTAEVRSLSLGKRRVARLERMGVAITEGKKLRLTLSFDCVGGHEQVQFCLHEDLSGKPHVVCHKLTEPGSRCQEPPPRPPGHMINPPPKSSPVNEDKSSTD